MRGRQIHLFTKDGNNVYSTFKAFGIFDPTYHEIMRALYDDAIDEYGRKVPHDSANIADTVTSTTAPTTSSGTSVLGHWTQFVVTLILTFINLFSKLF